MMSVSLPEFTAVTSVLIPICWSHSETNGAASTEVCSELRTKYRKSSGRPGSSEPGGISRTPSPSESTYPASSRSWFAPGMSQLILSAPVGSHRAPATETGGTSVSPGTP